MEQELNNPLRNLRGNLSCPSRSRSR